MKLIMNNQVEKYQYVFEDDDSISTWKYDKRKSSGVVEVEIKWKKIPVVEGKKTMKDYLKK